MRPDERLDVVLFVWVGFSLLAIWQLKPDGGTLKERLIWSPLAIWIMTGILSVFAGVGLLAWRCYLFLKDGYWLHLTNEWVLRMLDIRVPPLSWRGVDWMVRSLLGWDSTLTLIFAIPIAMIIILLLAIWLINSMKSN